MCAGNAQNFLLEHYLRITTKKPRSWLSALQVLTGFSRLSQEVNVSLGEGDFDSRLSFLEVGNINVCGVYLRSACSVVGCNDGRTAIIMPAHGSVDFEVEGLHFYSVPGVPCVLKPDAEFRARMSSGANLFIVQISHSAWKYANGLLESADFELAKILVRYLRETPFFWDHHYAMERTRLLEETLNRYLAGESPVVATVENKILIEDDRRLLTAIELINDRLATDIKLEKIARDSGMSLRNFYYLMKKRTGMTPYSYCQSRRLIKARESLISFHREDPVIANHALKWGFNHAGRFSSYYFDHFGEYPSDTIQGVKLLERHSEQVVSTDTGAVGQKTVWYTSRASSAQEVLAG
ncbi:AraC family transcriptional regulator [Marinobacter sp. BSs20148]|jgi:AraC-like DNA-binding protein|uniref:AraC family transcriptional regulator n=1 Tax=Marinobacter sp. BSs20148 TaxID=490759 RepID=UPI0002776B3B|nr:AraC family transcriptional regulator [Marinobacter sp. BSs20148]AFP29256.1 XylDLEGF operon transcriptional activator 1 [Marinobacter sp. BSs20148]